ncbi:Ankyrin repeat [Balamuthia mandrillaris]
MLGGAAAPSSALAVHPAGGASSRTCKRWYHHCPPHLRHKFSISQAFTSLPLLQWSLRNGFSFHHHHRNTTIDNDDHYYEEHHPSIYCILAAKHGDLQGCPLDVEVCSHSAAKGDLDMLQWARAVSCPWDWSACLVSAAEHGHLEVLEWARKQMLERERETPCYWHEEERIHLLRMVCNAAAENGHLLVLRWVKRRTEERNCGCSRLRLPSPWDERTCLLAAMNGHLEVLQWLRSEEVACPWDKRTSQAAASTGHSQVLQWAREHGCPS